MKEDREGQILCDFTYMWNLKNRINKQNRRRLTDAENILMVVVGEGGLENWVER